MKISTPRHSTDDLLVGAKSGNCICCVCRMELGVTRHYKRALCPEAGISGEKVCRLQAVVWETQLLFPRLRHKDSFFKKVTWLDRRIQERVSMITCQEIGGKNKDNMRQGWKACSQELDRMGFGSQLHDLVALWFRAGHFTSLNCSFCILKMGMIILLKLPSVC